MQQEAIALLTALLDSLQEIRRRREIKNKETEQLESQIWRLERVIELLENK